MNKLPVVILISGHGSNLQAIIDAVQQQTLAIDIKAVISNNPTAYGLQRAMQAKIPTTVIPHTDFADRNDFDLALQQSIDSYQPQLIALAGFMRRLGDTVVQHYVGRMINIHPSLLPKYPGLNTHDKVRAAGDTKHGSSIHFVTEDLDGGPVICQTQLNVPSNITTEQLKQQVQALEHQLYPEALRWFADDRITLDGNQVLLDKQALAPQGIMLEIAH